MDASMEEKTFLILGGYGSTSTLVSNLLLQESDARLVLAGRTIEMAKAAAAQLNSRFFIGPLKFINFVAS